MAPEVNLRGLTYHIKRVLGASPLVASYVTTQPERVYGAGTWLTSVLGYNRDHTVVTLRVKQETPMLRPPSAGTANRRFSDSLPAS